MLKVPQYDYIRTAHRVYGKSIKQIARETGHSRNTIRRALKGEYSDYKPRAQQPYPVLGPYLSIIDAWLKDDQDRPRKQRHTATRIIQRLKKEHEYTGGSSTVSRYVREAKLRIGLGNQRAFIPLEIENLGEAEVDWGTAYAILDGVQTQIKFFCMRSKYSGHHFVRLYPCERQQAFFDAHVKAFQYFGGVFPVLIYDNLTTAVQKVLKGKKRVMQENFSKFNAYYSFTPRFCNVAAGHEKGGVEGIVGFSRRNYMVPVPEARTLDELNEKILAECIAYGGHTIKNRPGTVSELFAQEKDKLLPLPAEEFCNIVISDGKSDKYSTVIVDKNRYSVPTEYAQLKLKVLLFAEKVEIYWDNKRIATHGRLFNNNQWCLKPDHYLDLIQRRPQAFESARPIKQWRKVWPASLEILLERFCEMQGQTTGIKDFISVLMFYRDHSASDIQDAVEKALKANLSTSDGVKSLLFHPKRDETKIEPLDQWDRLPAPDVTVYGKLGGLQ